MNQKRIFLIIGFFLVASLVFGLIFLNKDSLFSAKDQVKYGNQFEIKKENSKQVLKDNLKIECEEDWDKYENDVLGIVFCYPKKWGEVVIEPIENLTLLEGAMDEYSKDENNAYANSLFIKFKDNQNEAALNSSSDIEIRIFNDNYRGEHYPNSRAYDSGYIDNIVDLKNSGDICEYKINFTELWEEQGRMTEFWNDCDDGIKTTLINHEQYFDKALYSYDLESLAYLKLQNNFFDNVLVKRRYLHISQVEKKINNFQEIFEAKNYPSNVDNSKIISQGEFDEQKKEFGKFVRSFQNYLPVVSEKKDFEKIEGEDDKIVAIRKYYWLLENQNLEEAYKMQNRSNVSLDDFKSFYGKIRLATARDFKKINDSTFKFFVDYQNHNKPKTVYRIAMRVLNDGKIEVITSEEIVSEMVNYGGYSAYVKIKDNKSFVILEKYGIEVEVDEGVATYDKDHSNINEVKFFGDIKFSKSGNYLMYKMQGWEWSMNYVYDVNEGKKIFEYNGPHALDFDKDEQSLFICSNSGMSSAAAGIIYSVPEFKKQFELFKADNSMTTEVGCNYDESKNELTFVYDKNCELSSGACKKIEVIYSFEEDKMISSKALNN